MAQHNSRPDLLADLVRHEDLRLTVYDDATGKPITKGDTLIGYPTIGVGFNLANPGLLKAEILYILDNRIPLVERECLGGIECFGRLDRVRQEMVMNLCFAMGWPTFSKFKKLFAALDLQNWQAAAREVLNSKWAATVGDRARYIAYAIEHGQRRP